MDDPIFGKMEHEETRAENRRLKKQVGCEDALIGVLSGLLGASLLINALLIF